MTHKMKMGPKLSGHCCVKGCANTYRSRKDKELYFYSVGPVKKRSEERFALWMTAMQPTGMSSEVIERSVVCSEHFDTSDYEESDLLRNRLMGGEGTYKRTPRLKETAVPHKNLFHPTGGKRRRNPARNQNKPTKNVTEHIETRNAKKKKSLESADESASSEDTTSATASKRTKLMVKEEPDFETDEPALFEFVPMEGLPNTIKVEPLDEEIDIIHEPIGIEESEQQLMKTEIQTKAVEEMLVPTSESQNNSIDPIAVSPPSHTSNKHKRKSCKAQPLIEKLTQNLSKFELDYKKHMMEHAEDCCMEYNGPHVYRYFCPFCFHMFPDSNPFLIHMGFKSTMSSRFLAVHRISVRCDCMVMCHFCSTIYDSILTYQNHVENTMGDSSHDFGRHMCLVCNSKFKSLCGLNRHHKQIHKPVFQHLCRLCDTHFPNNLSLEVHRTLCHRDMYYCVTCDNYFMTPMDSKEHERENTSHVTKKYFVCTVELFRDDSKTNPILNNESGNGKTQPDGTNAKFDHKSLSETVNILPDSLQNSSKHDPKNGSISSTVKMLPDDLKNNPKYGHESVKMLQKDSENITIVTLPPDLQNNPRLNQESATNSSPVKMLPLQNNPQFDHENVTIIQMPDLQNNRRLDLEAITEGSTISSVTQTRSTPIIFNDLQNNRRLDLEAITEGSTISSVTPIIFNDLQKTITTYENIMNQPVQKYSDDLLSHMFEDLFVKFESLNRCETNETSYYVCPYCCMIFNTKVGFLFHVGVVLGDQKSKSFTNAHLVPLNISQLKCVYCEVVTSPDLETYHSHLNIKHLQEPKYQCGPECNAKFSFICELNKHKMSCVKCAQFIRCHNCKAAFKNILGFWSHERMCKKLNAFCVDCKVQFQTLIKFESHQCKKQEDNCVLLPIETQTTNSGLKITDFVKCNKCMSAAVCPLLQKLNSTFVAKSKS